VRNECDRFDSKGLTSQRSFPFKFHTRRCDASRATCRRGLRFPWSTSCWVIGNYFGIIAKEHSLVSLQTTAGQEVTPRSRDFWTEKSPSWKGSCLSRGGLTASETAQVSRLYPYFPSEEWRTRLSDVALICATQNRFRSCTIAS
jgi:hypothetical protein